MLSPASPPHPSPPLSPTVSEISVGAPTPPPHSPNSISSPQNRSDADNSNFYTQNTSECDNTTEISEYESLGHRNVDMEHRQEGDDYFRPLKKLKMMHLNKQEVRESRTLSPERNKTKTLEAGVKSFSIVDILGHKKDSNPGPARIVRPWDLNAHGNSMEHNLERLHHHLKTQISEHMKLKQYELSLKSNSFVQNPFEHRIHLTPFEIQQQLHLQEHLKVQQQYQLLRHHHQNNLSNFSNENQKDLFNNSESGSDRSSSVASDCCSPDIGGNTTTVATPSGSRGNQKGTPLDALFQMTSKTFEETAAENAQDSQSHLNLFNNRPQPKKKRKSRTAFTNHQIFELEKRFLYQKYLSPADRDEIASSLGLSNAQVITWFQNRRAKLKRDMEELKKDVESAKVLSAHKSFLENVTDLGILKKKAVGMSSDDCPTNLVMNK